MKYYKTPILKFFNTNTHNIIMTSVEGTGTIDPTPWSANRRESDSDWRKYEQ